MACCGVTSVPRTKMAGYIAAPHHRKLPVSERVGNFQEACAVLREVRRASVAQIVEPKILDARQGARLAECTLDSHGAARPAIRAEDEIIRLARADSLDFSNDGACEHQYARFAGLGSRDSRRAPL